LLLLLLLLLLLAIIEECLQSAHASTWSGLVAG
jgi:hypothetical protein